VEEEKNIKKVKNIIKKHEPKKERKQKKDKYINFLNNNIFIFRIT
jgi:hypothetical protein